MIRGQSALVQALLGTLFTWSLTAAGSALVFVFNSQQRKILDASLGFAAGVMIAASYWSLLAPAIEVAETTGLYGSFAFVPVSIGFLLGAFFVYAVDLFIPCKDGQPSVISYALNNVEQKSNGFPNCVENGAGRYQYSNMKADNAVNSSDCYLIHRRSGGITLYNNNYSSDKYKHPPETRWKRILMLIIAITVHNIPEGLAVGVGFAAVNTTKSSTFESARNLALGIGIQNFPEGFAVSLPLRGSGMSAWKSFWYGQLSGIVEPMAGILGAAAVSLAEPLLPYALAFAAGAMIYVVVDDIVPEAQMCGNSRLASWSTMAGFVVMMALDVGLG